MANEEKKYLTERIQNLTTNRKRYQLFVIIFFIISLTSVIIALMLQDNSPLLVELSKFGFGIIMSLLSVFFQNEKLKVDNKLTSLKYLSTQLERDPNIKSHLITKALEEI